MNCDNKDCKNRIPSPSNLAKCIVKTLREERGKELVLMTTEKLKEGDIIGQYTGKVTMDEGQQSFYSIEMCLFKYDDSGIYDGFDKGKTQQPVSKFHVDATERGNLTRFMSHSCDPNCECNTYINDGEAQVWVKAIRDVEGGEPLTIDYGDDASKLFKGGICFCGSKECRYKSEADEFLK